MLAVQGPQGHGPPLQLFPAAARLRFRHSLQVQAKGIPVLLHRAGYTEKDERYELYVQPDKAGELWQLLLEAGQRVWPAAGRPGGAQGPPRRRRPALLGDRPAARSTASISSAASSPTGCTSPNPTLSGWSRSWSTWSRPADRRHVPVGPAGERPAEALLPSTTSTCALKAAIVPFAGYEMPVRYSGISEEHLAVRPAAGLFDVSHMGVFGVRGEHATAFLDAVLTNYVAALRPGQATYSYLLDPDGRHPRRPRTSTACARTTTWWWSTPPTRTRTGPGSTAVNERRVIIDTKHPVRGDRSTR